MSNKRKKSECSISSAADDDVSQDLEKGDMDATIMNNPEDERAELQQFIDELQAKIKAKQELRNANSVFAYPGEEYFCRLDSSFKKNTAFVKKLKQFTASQLDATMRDMSTLNLSKYISEICTSLSETKLKMTDVNAVVTLCSKLHQTYADFDQYFFEAWQKILALKPGEKISNPSKLRVDLRLFADLISSGVVNTKQGLALLGSVLVNLIAVDKEDHSNFSIILSFCRHCGEEYAGLVPTRMKALSEKFGNIDIPKSDLLPNDKQMNLRSLLKDYFKTLCKHVLAEQNDLNNMTKNIRRTMESKGEISSERKEKWEMRQASFDKLLSSAQTLADLIGEPLPKMTTEVEKRDSNAVIENMMDNASFGDLDPWGDEETRSFYTDLPDLRQFLPDFSAPKVNLEQLDEPGEMTEEAIDANIDSELDLDEPPSASPEKDNDTESIYNGVIDDAPNGVTTSNSKGKSGNALDSGRQNHSKSQFDYFLHNLFNCVNKELIDSAAIEFLLNFNTKNNRKKITKVIFAVQRTRLDMLPFLSRFVAIINLCNTSVATELGEMLKKELKWHLRMKNQLNIESKIKVVRFIGEMVKFGLFKKFDALGCLKLLLRDFQHHHIEMACAFVEVTGTYLYNCRDSRLLTNVFLDQMLRLKTATALDTRHAAQVENVYYLVKPPEAVKSVEVLRPPMHEYIRYLIFEELCKQNVDRCIKMMRRINWKDPSIGGYAIKCLSKAYLLRFPLIRCLADLVSGLSSYQPRAIEMVIDNVFEDIRAGLEIHSPKLAQRRIAMAKYLGEMYNYKLVESTQILNTLYSIITLGISTEEGSYSSIDPPDSLFRLKLACVLLDTCGPYFTSAPTRKKLDYFLVFFQHYYWFKKSHPVFKKDETHSAADLFPILVDHMYRDCLLDVRPKLKHYHSYEEAKEAVEKIKLELYPQLNNLSNSKQQLNESDEEGACAMSVINETSELDEALSDDSSSASCEGSRERRNTDAEHGNTDWTENEIDREPGFDYKAPSPPEVSKEDLEFEQLYEKMTSDAYHERAKEAVKTNKKDIPVPMTARLQKRTFEILNSNSFLSATSSSSSSSSSNSSTGSLSKPLATDMNSVDSTSTTGDGKDFKDTKNGAVPFVLMVRGGKGNKQQLKSFVAPSDSQLAINLKMQEEKIREEKESVKRLTLNITERIEEEDYEDSILQPPRHYIQNNYLRPNRKNFKHQKGAPDVDFIFN